MQHWAEMAYFFFSSPLSELTYLIVYFRKIYTTFPYKNVREQPTPGVYKNFPFPSDSVYSKFIFNVRLTP